MTRSWNVEKLSAFVVDTAFHIHKDFDLIKRIVGMSLETMKIVKALPKLTL